MKITAKIKTTTTSGRPTGLLVCRTAKGLLRAAIGILIQAYGAVQTEKIIKDEFIKEYDQWRYKPTSKP